jgi:aerobic carbon-monoxide dehydrogenase small subunit
MLRFTVNGTEAALPDVPAGESLLTALRERCGLRGTKNACEQGECGSCLVVLDGRSACSCLVPAHQVHGRTVVTIEGLSPGNGELSTIQQAFLERGAVQCGFCTPGLVVAVHDLLDHHPEPTAEQTREALAGNLCRCTGYHGIFEAVALAAQRRKDLRR